MSWLVPNESQPMPLSTDFTTLLQDVRATRKEFGHPAVDEMMAELRETHVNGGALFACFALSENATLDWLLSRNRLEVVLDRVPILRSDAVFSVFNELCNDPRVSAEPAWEGMHSLVFAGELAAQLHHGGAYRNLAAPRAHDCAERFRDALFQDRYEDIVILRTHTPWNGWFRDIAWDCTYIVLDKRQQHFFLILWTDTD